MDVSLTVAHPGPLQTPAPAAAPMAAAGSDHPLIWAVLLVWLSVEAIGDGLRALSNVLASSSAERSHTPTATPS